MGCGCFTVSKHKSLIDLNGKIMDRKVKVRRNMVYTINNWNNVLDFLSYKELNTTARVCR